MEKPKFVYVTYIRTTPEKVWNAVTKPEFARQYWGGMVNVSDWKKGSKWNHLAEQKDNEVWVTGEVVESNPPKSLTLTWIDPDDLKDRSQVRYEIEAVGEMVKLTVLHSEFSPGSTMQEKVSKGWPLVLSSMKSFLETGKGMDIWSAKIGCAQNPAD